MTALREPRIIAPRLVDRCATVKGWWGIGAVLVPETRAGTAGFRMIRPFSFVRERNPSLGWPSWFALDAILADCGWIAGDSIDAVPIRSAAYDPMFEEPVTIQGVLRRPAKSTVHGLWEELNGLAVKRDAGPYGQNLLPIVLQVHGR